MERLENEQGMGSLELSLVLSEVFRLIHLARVAKLFDWFRAYLAVTNSAQPLEGTIELVRSFSIHINVCDPTYMPPTKDLPKEGHFSDYAGKRGPP